MRTDPVTGRVLDAEQERLANILDDKQNVRNAIAMRKAFLLERRPIYDLRATPADCARYGVTPWIGKFIGITCVEDIVDKRTRGLYQKFRVTRVDGTDTVGAKHHDCEYFVLDLTHDPHAIPALRAYAASAGTDGYAALALELYEKANALAAQRGQAT